MTRMPGSYPWWSPWGSALQQHSVGHELDPRPFEGPDADGDGIPDHHDFCPEKCTEENASCSPGWLSGRATDFDGDGCEDGVEDLDKDNDGVRDSVDRCPSTPQHYAFVSNHLNDFDGDGCVDGVEDPDDDGDHIPNGLDRCPRTNLADDNVDAEGCTPQQLEEVKSPELRPPGMQNLNDLAAAKPPEAAEPPAWWEELIGPNGCEWLGLIRSAWVEVLMGAVLTSLLHHLSQIATMVHQQIPDNPTDTVQRVTSKVAQGGHRVVKFTWPALRQTLVRAAGYFIFFVGVYSYRAYKRSLKET